MDPWLTTALATTATVTATTLGFAAHKRPYLARKAAGAAFLILTIASWSMWPWKMPHHRYVKTDPAYWRTTHTNTPGNQTHRGEEV